MSTHFTKLNRFTFRVMALLIALVTLSIFVMATLSYTKLYEASEVNAAIRIDRAARAAASIFSHSLANEFVIERDESGRPEAIRILAGSSEKALTFRNEHDSLLKEIGLTNQGAANLFKLNPITQNFDRFATTFRNPDGSMPPPMSLSRGHPAYDDLMANRPHIGDVPVMGRLRLAYLTPIQSPDGTVSGALAVDVGWVDDLHTARLELQTLIAGSAIAILMLVVGLGIWRMTAELQPLKKLANFANDLASGNNKNTVPYTQRSDEVGALAQGLSRVVDIQHELAYLAYTDKLTGLGNRSRYLADLNKVAIEVKTNKCEWALLHINLDRFKDVNVAFGQSGGDTLLKQVASAIKETAGDQASISRLSGDQFAVLVPLKQKVSSHSRVCSALLIRLNKPFNLGPTDLHLSASLGVVRLPQDAAGAEEAHLKADLALRKAKDDGGNCCAVFVEEMYMHVQSQIELERNLREAIINRRIIPHFQPQIDPSDNSLTGLEALARWHDETKGMISPSEFIPVAESKGLIVELGSLILDQTCRQARDWVNVGFDFKHLSVNVSPIQLLQPDFVNVVRCALERYQLSGQHICLEVTESLFVEQDEGRIRAIFGKLKALGVSLSLDDFGSGYSSLGYLNRLPFDQLKVDRSFVMNVDKDVHNQKLLAGIVTLGQGLGLSIVAEGAETREEVECVAKIGCNSIQGYFHAKPMVAADIPQAVEAIFALGQKITKKRA